MVYLGFYNQKINQTSWLFWRYSLLRRHVAEKKFVVERVKGDRCEARFYWKKYKLDLENISLRKIMI